MIEITLANRVERVMTFAQCAGLATGATTRLMRSWSLPVIWSIVA